MATPDKLKMVKEIGHRAITFSAARGPSADRLYLGGSDFKVYEADPTAAKFEPKELYAHESYVTGVALTGSTLITGSYDCKLTWYDLQAKKVVRSVSAHTKWIRGVFPSPDGKTVISVADDMVARLWNAADGTKLFDLKGHAEKTPTNYHSMLYCAAFSPDGKYVATGDKLGKILVWDVATGKQTAEMHAPVMYTWEPNARLHSIGGLRSLAYSADGKLLAAGGMGKVGNIDHLEGKARIELFETAGGKRVWEWQSDKFNGLVNHLEIAPDGTWVMGAGGAGEGFLLFVDRSTGKTVRQEKVPFHVHDVVPADGLNHLTLVGHNKIALWEMKG